MIITYKTLHRNEERGKNTVKALAYLLDRQKENSVLGL